MTLGLRRLLSEKQIELARIEIRREARRSHYYKDFARRQFHNPKGYKLWPDLIEDLATFLVATDSCNPIQLDYAAGSLAFLLREIHATSAACFPCYWLDKNLGEAFLNTDLPPVFQLARSQPFGVVFLPQGLLRSPDGHAVEWFMFRHRIRGESTSVLVGSEALTFPAEEDVLQIALSCGKHLTIYFSGCSLERTGSDGKPWRNDTLILPPNQDKNVESKFLDTIQSIAIQSLFWLSSYQPKEAIPSGAGFGGSIRQLSLEFPIQNPRWIGKNFSNYSKSIGDKQPQKDRKSPCTHWRRGSWRNQRVGAGRIHTKLIWIKPTLINSLIEQ